MILFLIHFFHIQVKLMILSIVSSLHPVWICDYFFEGVHFLFHVVDYKIHLGRVWGFSDRSVGEESTCSAGDPSLIPGSEKSAGEGIGYPLQYSWASLVAHLVKNLPAMLEDMDSIPGLGRSPGKGKGYALQYSGLENHSRTWLSDFHFHSLSSWKMKVQSTQLHSSLPKYIKYISVSYELIVHKTNSFFKS